MVNVFRSNLRAWVLAAMAVLAIPFFLFAFYALNKLGAAEQERLSSQLLNGAQATADAVGQRLATGAGYLNTLAVSDAARHHDLPALYAHAQRVMHQLPDASAITLVAPDYRIVFLTLQPFGTPGPVANELDDVKTVFDTGRPVVSAPFKSPVRDRMVVAISVPVRDGDKVVYCLRLILLTSALNDMLVAQRLPEEWTVSVIAGNGQVVARSRKPEAFIGQLVRPEVMAALKTREPKVFNGQTLEGDAVKAAVVPLRDWGWSVAVGVPQHLLDRTVQQGHVLLAMFGLAIAVLGGLFSYGVQRWALAQPPVDGVADWDAALRQIKGAWPAVLALTVAMLVSVLALWAEQNSLDTLKRRADQRLAASALRTQVAELLSQLKDLETGQRGFVITGQEPFLVPYQQAQEQLPGQVAVIKAALIEQGIEGFRWTEFDGLLTQRQALAAQAIDERRTMGQAVLNDAALFERGRLAMDKLRLELGALDGLLAQRVQALSDQLSEESQQATQVQWLAFLAAGVLTAFAIGFWLLERQRRKQLFKELAFSHEQLEQRVLERTLALQEASARIRSFSIESQRSIEAERKRLSREVHDQIGQVFTGIKMILKTMRPESLAPDQQAALATALDMGVKTTRRIAAELRPPLLDDLGLRAALDLYLSTQLTPAGLSHDLDIPDDHGLNNEQATQLFRVVQEATTNTLRHAQASHVSVTLQASSTAWALWVDDNGVGWDGTPTRVGSLGLTGMQERAQMLGGQLRVSLRSQGGTRVALHIPRENHT